MHSVFCILITALRLFGALISGVSEKFAKPGVVLQLFVTLCYVILFSFLALYVL
jgi:hypothetical protein